MRRETYQNSRLRESWDDTTGRYTRMDPAGAVVEDRALSPAEAAGLAADGADQTRRDNAATVQRRARNALTANATFLALASPTNAQTLAQVRLLTRECNALIRLALNDLDAISDTNGGA